MTADLEVSCEPVPRGWMCDVRLREDRSESTYEVSVSQAELDRYLGANESIVGLVERSFRFLLEREPQESILPVFQLSEIERYFPEYRAWIVQ